MEVGGAFLCGGRVLGGSLLLSCFGFGGGFLLVNLVGRQRLSELCVLILLPVFVGF